MNCLDPCRLRLMVALIVPVLGLSFLSQFTFRLDYQQKLVSFPPLAGRGLTEHGTSAPLQTTGGLLTGST